MESQFKETIMPSTVAETSASARENGISWLNEAGIDLSQMTLRLGCARTRVELDHFLRRLLPAHREVIELVDFALKSVEEASEIIGLPQATIKTRLFYARKALVDVVRYQGNDRVAA
jgi:DNA-directed RNA polymerase specialized sigma24 family protein